MRGIQRPAFVFLVWVIIGLRPIGSTGDLPTIAFFRASTLLRRNGPVPGILAAHWPGAIMDKSGRRFVVHFQLIEQPKNLAEKTNQKTRNYNLDLSSQRGHANQVTKIRIGLREW